MVQDRTAREAALEAFTPGRELAQSLLLIGAMLSTVAATVGVAMLLARVLAG